MVAEQRIAITAQEALAKLVVNPHATALFLKSRCPSSAGLNMTECEQRVLVEFINNHAQAFRASVLLLRKRRMDNVLEALGVISRLFSEYELACYWDDYLSLLDIHAATPKNPLLESICFARHILADLPPCDVHASLVEYEVTKNEVIARVASDESATPDVSRAEALDQWAPYVHPAIQSATFHYNVSLLVKMISGGSVRGDVLRACVRTDETLVFFKNWRKGGVGTMRASNSVFEAMIDMNGRKTAKCFIDRSDAFSGLMKSLGDLGAMLHVAAKGG